jgi:RNA polymerase sigma factor (sigma-70 family)
MYDYTTPPVDLSTKDGQRAAVKEYYAYIQSCIYHRVKREPNPHKLTADLAQDAFAKAMDKIERGSGPKDEIQGWIARFTYNLVADHFRKEKKKIKVMSSYFQDKSLHHDLDEYEDNSQELKEQFLYVSEYIENLAPQPKKVVKLWMKGHSPDEIHDITGLNKAQIKSYKNRGLRIARERLAKDGICRRADLIAYLEL